MSSSPSGDEDDVHAGLDRERQRRVGGLRDVVAFGEAEHLVRRRHHDPGEAPLGAQHLLQQPGVGVQRDAVVRDGGGQDDRRARADRRLARGQHRRPQRPLRPAVVDPPHRLPRRAADVGHDRGERAAAEPESGRRPAGRTRGRAPARAASTGSLPRLPATSAHPARPSAGATDRPAVAWTPGRGERARRGRGHLGDEVGVPGGRPGERGWQDGQVGRVVQRHRERRDRPAGGRPDPASAPRRGRCAIVASGRGPTSDDAGRGAVDRLRHAARAEHGPDELADLLLDAHLGHQVGDEPLSRPEARAAGRGPAGEAAVPGAAAARAQA